MRLAYLLLRSNGISIGNKIYFFLRFLMLPISEIDAAIPKNGKILDLGCGIGSLSFFLAVSSKKRIVLGWDIDRKRILVASKITKNIPNIKFEIKNALDVARIEGLSGIVASDVLHHMNFSQQEELITNIWKALSENGVLVIKEVDNKEKIRAWFSLLWDRLFYRNEISYFRTKDDWIKLFKKNGFLVEVKKTMWWFPGSQTLFICKKQ